jgi:hypothetical protein
VRKIVFALVVITAGLVGQSAARADHAPVIVIPGRPDVPVIINGRDASYAVVEGDWGLYRAGAPPAPTVTYAPHRFYARPYGHYFPMGTTPPRLGRFEVEPPPNRALPPPAPSYHRSWSTDSDPLPATIINPEQPAVVVAPQVDRNRWRWWHRHRVRRR